MYPLRMAKSHGQHPTTAHLLLRPLHRTALQVASWFLGPVYEPADSNQNPGFKLQTSFHLCRPARSLHKPGCKLHTHWHFLPACRLPFRSQPSSRSPPPTI